MTMRPNCPGPITRRGVLRAGALGFFGLNWPLYVQAARAAGRSKAKACILVYLDGGMSHIDTLDMKPEAPAEYRGEFRPIASTLPGVQVCEHLPRLARVLHHCSLVRSMGQRGRGIIGDNHHTGAYYYLTGHVPDASFGQQGLNRKPQPDDWPFIGSVVALKKGARAAFPLVGLPDRAHSAEYIRAGQFGARLGHSFDPLLVQGDPDRPGDFTGPALNLPTEVSLSRLADRHGLLRQLDQERRRLDREVGLREFDRHQDRAFGLLGSAVAGGAFDLEREPVAMRQRYGDDVNGQSMLLGRRLVEAGVPFVSVFWQPRRNKAELCSGWDTHRNNFHCLKTYLLPYLDVGFSALIEDLAQRGLLDETLVVLMSEMGRKTRIGDPRSGGANGRDHWVHCQTVLLAGGGIRPSFVFGASDRTASFPVDRPVGPEDLAATIYDAMGITDLTARSREGQQFNLLEDGEPMRELFA
jgi:hypothetical protein